MNNIDFYKEYEDRNGFDLSDEVKELLEKQDFECDCCGNDSKETFDDYQVVDDRREEKEDVLLCWNCYQDDYLTTCSICEDSFENPETPQETVLYVNECASKEIGRNIGFYQVLKFPYYLSDGFSMSVFDDTLKQFSSIDLRKLGYDDSDMSRSKVCPECASIFKGEKRIVNNYCNRKANLHSVIYKRGLIKSSLLTNV